MCLHVFFFLFLLSTMTFLLNSVNVQLISLAQLDASPIGDQNVVGLTHAWLATFILGD